MGRKKKTLHDCAAEFTDLVVKQPLTEHSDSGDMSVVETLSCRACELPMRVPRDRILEHLSWSTCPRAGAAGTADSSAARPADAHSRVSVSANAGISGDIPAGCRLF